MTPDPIKITDDLTIGDGHPCFVVAEIGQNHNGDARIANDLWKAAWEAKASAVKFTKRHIPSDMTTAMRNEPYVNEHSFGATYGQHRERLELSIEELQLIRQRAVDYNGWNLPMFCTVCDRVSLEEIESELNPPLYKIASRDLDNLPLLDAVAQTGKPVILSSGMHDLDTVSEAIETIRFYHGKVIVLHCVSAYPTPYEAVCLKRMQAIRERFNVNVGWSDHTAGIALGPAAVAMGACVLEYHLTKFRAMKGRDHACSLEPNGFEKLVEYVRATEQAIRYDHDGGGFYVQSSKSRLGRSIVTARNIPAGEQIIEADLCLKSPGDGLPWHRRSELVGGTAISSIPADTTLLPEMVYEAEGAWK